MLLIDDTRADLPAALTDAVVTHHTGLRRVRLLRVAGQRGAELLEHATWVLQTELGEPPAHDEPPSEESDSVAATVYERALEALAAGGKDKRFKIELTNATEDGEKTETVGFQVDARLATSHHGASIESAQGRSFNELANYIGMLQRQNVMLLEGTNKGMRIVFAMLPQLVSERIAAAEDRIEAALERAGVEQPSSGDEAWKLETIKGIRDLTKLIAPRVFGGGEEVPKESLRGRLRELGESLSDEQKSKLAGLVGLELGMKLRQAGQAESDAESAELLAEFIAGVDAEKLADLLEDRQREMLSGIFDELERIVDAAESSASSSANSSA